MNYRKIFLEKIDNLLNSNWTVPEFQDKYYNFYLSHSSSEYLNELETTFFGLVQEKLDWTAENPAENEKKYGWMDYNEFKEWLKINTKKFLEEENLK